MERHFVLPVTFAAAFHAALLFGFRPSTASSVADPVRTPKSDPTKPPVEVILDQPKEDATREESAPPKGSPTTARPTAPELPAVDSFDRMTMDRPPATPAAPGAEKFDLRPPGVENGTEMGIDLRAPPIGAGQLDNPPRARLQSSPAYPFEARHRGLAGSVTVEFTVDETGAVRDPRVMNSTDRVFEEATLKAVAKWRFEPGRRAGRIVRFRMAVPVVFNLNGD